VIRFARLAPALIVALATIGAGRVSATPAAAPARATRPASTLSVLDRGAWREWWRADRAPERWPTADSTLAHALRWTHLADGIEWATVRLGGDAPAWRMKLVVVALDPRRVDVSLDFDLTRGDARPAWTIDRAPKDALVALNAGQFVGAMPWGWVVIGGIPRLRPGTGPLSTALAIDRDGGMRWIPGDSLAVPPADAVTAFQSYPTLLAGDGAVRHALRVPGLGVDLAHRDARLAIGGTRDGRLLIALTRFDALGETAGAVPIGPTTPEMAAVMGALGARDAVMLDGGISAQMLLRDPRRGRQWRWPGWRKVPLALIVRPRAR
jgi:hypothetical protein